MEDADSSGIRRLNPFALPSETDARFNLFIIAAFMLVINLGFAFGYGRDIFQLSPEPPLPDSRDPRSIENGMIAWRDAFSKALTVVVLPYGLMLLALVFTLIIFRLFPYFIRRGNRLKELTREHDPPFFDAIQELTLLSGISPTPKVELTAESRSIGGRAFGFHRRYSVQLSKGTRLLFRKSCKKFRAIFLHELAHIANNDVQRTYFAQALWITAIILAIIPGSLYALDGIILGVESLFLGLNVETSSMLQISSLTLFIQFMLTFAVVVAVRSSLLRVREIYADWRSALWGAHSALTEILQNTAHENQARGWTFLSGLHPTTRQRLKALREPISLFQITFEVPFIVGVLLPMVMAGIKVLLGSSVVMILAGGMLGLLKTISITSSPILQSLLAVLILVIIVIVIFVIAVTLGFVPFYLVTDSLGLEVQRETIAKMITGQHGLATYLGLWRPAVLVAIGFQMGSLIAPLSEIFLLPERAVSAFLLKTIMQTVGLAILSWLWLAYVRFLAYRILGTHSGSSVPRAQRRLMALISTGLLFVLCLPILIGNLLFSEVTNPGGGEIFNSSFYLGALLVTGTGALLVYALALGITWLFLQARQFLRQARCPGCEKITRGRYAIGQSCEHCGHSLASWLFIEKN